MMPIMLEDQELQLIPMTKAHRGLVASTWFKSYLDTCKGISRDILFKQEQNAITRILDAGLAWVLVTSPEDLTVHSWVCGKPGLLHYTYVPPELRRKGLASRMTREVCAGLGYPFEHSREWPGNPPRWLRYNPYRLLET